LKVCAVICTYRRFDVLPEAIGGLLDQTYAKALTEIVVVDNSGQPELSREFMKRYRNAALRYLIEPIPGLSRARNIGWRGTDADIIAYIDDDAIASPDWITTLVDAYTEFGPEAAVVGGLVNPIWPMSRPSWLHDYMLGFLSIVDWGGERRVTADGEWLAGTNISFRRSLLEQFGGFDENLGRTEGVLLSNEEIALVSKMKAAGGKTIYDPDALVQHIIHPNRLTQDWFRRRAFWQAVSDLIMSSKSDLTPEHVWGGVTKYFRCLPPPQRTPVGFFVNPADAELFQKQLDSIYSLVRMFGYGIACPAASLLELDRAG
jgi:glycosyltransferase involved in cell wall biosynthesis